MGLFSLLIRAVNDLAIPLKLIEDDEVGLEGLDADLRL